MPVVEKTDITRKTNKAGTILMSVNPLRQHIDLQEKLSSSKNIAIAEKKKPKGHHRFESVKIISNFDLKKINGLNENSNSKK